MTPPCARPWPGRDVEMCIRPMSNLIKSSVAKLTLWGLIRGCCPLWDLYGVLDSFLLLKLSLNYLECSYH